MIPIWLGMALPWISLALGVIVAVFYLRASARSVQLHRRPILLGGLAVATLAALYVDLVWSGLVPDRYLRVERPFGIALTLAAAAFVAWRLATLSKRQSSTRRSLVESFGMLATLLAGFAVAGLDIGTPPRSTHRAGGGRPKPLHRPGSRCGGTHPNRPENRRKRHA